MNSTINEPQKIKRFGHVMNGSTGDLRDYDHDIILESFLLPQNATDKCFINIDSVTFLMTPGKTSIFIPCGTDWKINTGHVYVYVSGYKICKTKA